MTTLTCSACTLTLFSDGAVYGPPDCPLCLHCFLALAEELREDHALIRRSALLDEAMRRTPLPTGPMLPHPQPPRRPLPAPGYRLVHGRHRLGRDRSALPGAAAIGVFRTPAGPPLPRRPLG